MSNSTSKKKVFSKQILKSSKRSETMSKKRWYLESITLKWRKTSILYPISASLRKEHFL